LALGGLLVLELGARTVMPAVNGQALANYFHNGGGTWLLAMYDRLGGGGLSRGGVFALGIMPYLSARIMMRLSRVMVPAVDEMSHTPAGRIRLRGWTRVLTVGLSLVQSYGFARFAQSVPGVAPPGAAFIVQTMAVLTVGAIVAMALSEQISRPDDDDEPFQPLTVDPTLASGETVRAHVHTGEAVRVP
jgi:preprotein translocase subunit SecY